MTNKFRPPKPTIIKEYPEITILGEYYTADELTLKFLPNYIEAIAYVDRTGNTFKIPYEMLGWIK